MMFAAAAVVKDWESVETLKLATGPRRSNGKLASDRGYFC